MVCVLPIRPHLAVLFRQQAKLHVLKHCMILQVCFLGYSILSVMRIVWLFLTLCCVIQIECSKSYQDQIDTLLKLFYKDKSEDPQKMLAAVMQVYSTLISDHQGLNLLRSLGLDQKESNPVPNLFPWKSESSSGNSKLVAEGLNEGLKLKGWREHLFKIASLTLKTMDAKQTQFVTDDVDDDSTTGFYNAVFKHGPDSADESNGQKLFGEFCCYKSDTCCV